MKLHAALLLGLCLVTGAARAGLFDDDEARKDLAALRAQVGANQKSTEERLARVETLVQDRAIELAKLIDELKQDLARGEEGSGDKSDFIGKTSIHGQINEVAAPPDPPVVELQA